MKIQLTNAATKLCVIGHPVLHSKSPLIQNAMIQALGLDYIYLCQPVKGEETAQFLQAAQQLGYGGFNATMPHKQHLVPLMDELDEDARLYSSVNTVVLRDGKAYGHNTDGRGFYASLQQVGIEIAGKKVLILGAGGASKAVALKLVQQGASQVTIANRSVEKAVQLCQHNPQVMQAIPFDVDSLCQASSQADLLVNCTSLGMGGTDSQFSDLSFLEQLPTDSAVCDLIYHPAETLLLATAKNLGHKSVNGLGMLVYQAIFALEHFTGQALDLAEMAQVVKTALGE